MIRLFQPIITTEHEKAIINALHNEKYIDGESTEKFRDSLILEFDRNYCALCNSGTTALIVALRAAKDLKYVSKRVHTTPMSFISTGSAIVLAGLEPVFHDVDKNGMVKIPNSVKLAYSNEISLPVALYGKRYPYKLVTSIIEDDAQAHGTHNKDVLANCFSFYTTKSLSVCGYGGCIMTDDKKLFCVMESMINNGRVEGNVYKHQYISNSYRINNINAAIGMVNLKLLYKQNKKRRFLAKIYNENLKDIECISCPELDDHVFHRYVIRVSSLVRDSLRKELYDNGIESSVQYPIPIHKQPAFSEYNHLSLPEAERMAKEIISLPLHPLMVIKDVDKVSNVIRNYFGAGDL